MKRFELLADGAYGTNLLNYSPNPESLNLSSPEIVTRLHAGYVDAGSRIIRTNTFLSAETAIEGVRIARQTSRAGVEVIGCVGPKTSHDKSQTLKDYRNHMLALRKGGVNHLHAETMHTPQALELALKAALDLQFSEISVSAYLSRSFTAHEFIAIARDFGIKHIGLNCMPPDDTLRLSLTALLESPDIEHISIYPEGVGMEPSRWAESVIKVIDRLPVHAVGGCCGTTPAHIKELAKLQNG